MGKGGSSARRLSKKGVVKGGDLGGGERGKKIIEGVEFRTSLRSLKRRKKRNKSNTEPPTKHSLKNRENR